MWSTNSWNHPLLSSQKRNKKKLAGIKPKCLLIQITRPHQWCLSAAVSLFHSIISHQGQELWRKSSNRHTNRGCVSYFSRISHFIISSFNTDWKSLRIWFSDPVLLCNITQHGVMGLGESLLEELAITAHRSSHIWYCNSGDYNLASWVRKLKRTHSALTPRMSTGNKQLLDGRFGFTMISPNRNW